MKNKNSNYDYDIFLNGNLLPDKLSDEETKLCFERLSTDYDEAREQLIIHNIRLVMFIARKFNNSPYEMKDLVSAGIIGLIKSIDKFEINRDNKFNSYAGVSIYKEILYFIKSNKKNSNNMSLNENESEKLNNLYDDDFERKNDEQETYEIVRKIVAELPEGRRKEIIMRYFGFADEEAQCQREIAESFGITQSYISRELKNTLKDLEKKLKKEGIVGMPTSFYEKKQAKVLTKKK